MGSTTRLGLQSRTTRLAEGRSDRPSPSRPHGAVTLRGGPFEVTRPRRGPRRPPSEDYNSEAPGVGDRPIPGLGFARFIRHYWGHPRWFLFLRLLICLNSAGGRARFEAEGGGGGTAAPAGGPSRLGRVPSTRDGPSPGGGGRRFLFPDGAAGGAAGSAVARAGAARSRVRRSNGRAPAAGPGHGLRSKLQGFAPVAIRPSHRTSPRSSSNDEPRYPSSRVVPSGFPSLARSARSGRAALGGVSRTGPGWRTSTPSAGPSPPGGEGTEGR